MEGMSIQDYASIQKLMCGRSDTWGKGAGIWAIVAVIIILAIVLVWRSNCNEKVQFATAVAKLDGRLDAVEPAVTAHGNNLYKLNGVTSATVQGVKDLKENTYNQLFELNDEIFYNPGRRHRGGCGCNNSCGGREFKQTSTYNLASTNVTVEENCRN